MKVQRSPICVLQTIGFFILINSVLPTNTFATDFNKSELMQLLKKQDQFYSHGTIVYQKESPFPKVKNIDQNQQNQIKKSQEKNELKKITLKYNNELKFKRHTISLNTSNTTNIATLYDGKNEIVINGKYITLNTNSPVDIRGYMRMIGIYPGACYVYGRGLSTLQNIQVENAENNIRLKGSTPGGSHIIAVLDPKADFLAQQIERRTKQGKLISKMLLGKPTKTKNGKLIASSATYIIYNNGVPKATTQYKLISANLSKPSDKTFQFTPTNGQTIIDNRMGYPIVWKMTLRPGKKMTVDTLLDRTKKKLTKIRKTESTSRSMEQTETYRRTAFIIIPTIILIIIGCWQFYQIRLRRHSER